MTNYERIKNMTQEEMTRLFADMAEYLDCGICPAGDFCEPGDSCSLSIARWLMAEKGEKENARLQ